MELRYTVNLDSCEPIMLINKHIGFDNEDGYGIMGDLFQQELLFIAGLPGKERIQVWINSVGGGIVDGFSIFSAIQNSPIPADTYNMGIANSTAGWIMQAGRRRYVAPHSNLMIHDPFNPDDESSESKALKAMKASIVVMLASKSKMSESKISNLMSAETWFNAKESVTSGLADEILPATEYDMPELEKTVDSYKKASNYLNKALLINNQSKKMNYKALCNKLAIDEVDSEAEFVASIEKIVNKAKRKVSDIEEEMENKKTEMKKLQDQFTGLQDQLENAKKEAGEYKNKFEAEELAKKTESATALVNKHVERGAIKTEKAASWIKNAMDDFEGTKEKLEDIPVGKSAPGRIDQPVVVPGAARSVIAGTMGELRNKFKL